MSNTLGTIEKLLGSEAEYYLNYKAKVSTDLIHRPGRDWVDRIFSQSDRSPQVLRSLQQLFDNGRLAGTGYMSILPVDQGIEHSAGASFAPIRSTSTVRKSSNSRLRVGATRSRQP